MSVDKLLSRIAANSNSVKDFGEWSINLLPTLPINSMILDLGCGTGKQINLFKNFFSSDSIIVALDKCHDSLNILKENYQENDRPTLKIIEGDFDDYGLFHTENDEYRSYFDLIYSFYALYYSNNLELIIRKANWLLKNSGVFWVVGPYIGTNENIFELINKFYAIDKKVLYSVNQFYRDVINISANVGFKTVKINILKNKIIYNNADSLMTYLRNTVFFNSNYDNEIYDEIKKIFVENDNVSVPKNVISMQFGLRS